MTTTATNAWAAPVASATPPRQFLYESDSGTWEEIGPDFAWGIADSRLPVSAHPINGGWRLVLDCYHSSEGVCELRLTRPLAEALAVFGALIDADNEVESHLRPLPVIV